MTNVFLLIALGLILGSFVNAFVWRLHEGRNWVSERSECPKCHHVLSWMDLIPVLSWLLLQGKCRYCHKRIDDSPLTELALPALFVGSYLAWPLGLTSTPRILHFAAWLVFLVGFLALALYDFRWFILPDKLVFPLAGLALFQVLAMAWAQQDWHVLVGALLGVLIISGLFYALLQVSDGKWIGGGDVKLGLVLGLLAGGGMQAVLLIFVASVSGLLFSLPLMLKGKVHKRSVLPFGPFLILGLVIVQLFGTRIIDWYLGLLYM